jgi:hypothetical protein
MYATTKIVKIADSAAMRENIPTRPREGSVHGVSIAGIATGSVLIYSCLQNIVTLLVFTLD